MSYTPKAFFVAAKSKKTNKHERLFWAKNWNEFSLKVMEMIINREFLNTHCDFCINGIYRKENIVKGKLLKSTAKVRLMWAFDDIIQSFNNEVIWC